jgi:hypothetical protein
LIYLDKCTGKSTHVKVHPANHVVLKHVKFALVTSPSQSDNQYRRRQTLSWVMKEGSVFFDLQISLPVVLYIHVAQYFFLIHYRGLIVSALTPEQA